MLLDQGWIIEKLEWIERLQDSEGIEKSFAGFEYFGYKKGWLYAVVKSKLPNRFNFQICLVIAFDECRAAADFVLVGINGATDACVNAERIE